MPYSYDECTRPLIQEKELPAFELGDAPIAGEHPAYSALPTRPYGGYPEHWDADRRYEGTLQESTCAEGRSSTSTEGRASTFTEGRGSAEGLATNSTDGWGEYRAKSLPPREGSEGVIHPGNIFSDFFPYNTVRPTDRVGTKSRTPSIRLSCALL